MPEHTKAPQQNSKTVGTTRPASAGQEIQGQETLMPRGMVNRAYAGSNTLSPNQTLYLQRSIGNRATNQLLGRDGSNRPAPTNSSSGLRVGPADDVYEREARQVASQVASSSTIQRATASPSAPEVGRAGGAISGELESKILRAKEGGSLVSHQIRRAVEKETGDSYKDVHVHQGKSAQSINDGLGARAATLGKDIFLGRGQSPHDIQLMAHELTHVTQQRGPSGLLARATPAPAVQRAPLKDSILGRDQSPHDIQRLAPEQTHERTQITQQRGPSGLRALSATAPRIQRFLRGPVADLPQSEPESPSNPKRLGDKEYPRLLHEHTNHPVPKHPTTPNHWPTMMEDPRFNQQRDYTDFVYN